MKEFQNIQEESHHQKKEDSGYFSSYREGFIRNQIIKDFQENLKKDYDMEELRKNVDKLFISVKEDNLEELRKLGEINNIINEKNEHENTPLHYAILKGNIKMIKSLLEKGANPNIKGRNGLTPLYLATLKGFREIISLLLSNGADPALQDNRGNNSLHVAAEKNDLESLKLLANNNIELINSRNFFSRPILHSAASGIKENKESC